MTETTSTEATDSTDNAPNKENADAERVLIERAKTDAEAFKVLYRQYFPRIFAYVAYRVGDKVDAEDLVAEIFAGMVEGLERFEYRGDGAFAAWLFRIAHNQVVKYYRRRKGYLPPVPLDDLPELHSDTPTPDERLMQKERLARLRDTITTLSPRRQEIVTLRFFGELKNKEIAEVLGIDERTVASHLCRALEDLANKYDRDWEGRTP
ncbi:MAG: sigma-70 family RNA polymerase sigma factor [Aggregatilineales bacterium]